MDMIVDISDIETNELDDKPDDDDNDDPAIASVTDKIAKCEALVSSSSNGIINKKIGATETNCLPLSR